MITVQILKDIAKEMRVKKKKNKYTRLAKKYRRKFTKALRRMREIRRMNAED